MKEQCTNCKNAVIGKYTPSETRKWLTGLAKKGGMKAVLSAAASVIPGFGTVSGFVAGTFLDIKYGNNINKLVDDVADKFDDYKIFVFECPNCGHKWTRRQDISKNNTGVAQAGKLIGNLSKTFSKKLGF